MTTSVEIPGPVWHHGISHGLLYDHENFMVMTYGVVAGHRIISRQRPMCESEIIHSKLRGYDRATVLKAFGVIEEDRPLPLKKPWWQFW